MEKTPTELYFKDEGKGYPIVLLHGFLESLSMWNSLAAVLQKEYRVVSIDLPGHGKSKSLDSEPSIDQMANAVFRLLDNLQIKDAIIIGHSMGGYVGLALVEHHPELINSLILLHSKASEDSDQSKKKRDLGIEMLQRHPSLFIKESIQNLFWNKSVDSLEFEKHELIEDALKVDPQGYIDSLLAMKNRPNRTKLLNAGNSIVYIAGKNDPVIPIELSLLEMQRLPENSRVILENSGHMGFIEEKEKCEHIIYNSIQRLLKRH
jgi:pimeloyl-ACP methyl ester carboxylesterase